MTQENTVPLWYLKLLEIKPLIDSKNWAFLNERLKKISSLVTKMDTIRKPFHALLLASEKAVANNASGEIRSKYSAVMKFASAEKDADTYKRIAREEEFIDRIGLLTFRINQPIKIIWNYWRGDKAKDYLEWASLKKEISKAPLTKEGRFRLVARHTSLGPRIIPSFAKMSIQLWPIAALWVIKKIGTYVISSTVKNTMETRRTTKQLKSLKTQLSAGSKAIGSIGSIGLRKKAESE
jgi:hypothetical protein